MVGARAWAHTVDRETGRGVRPYGGGLVLGAHTGAPTVVAWFWAHTRVRPYSGGLVLDANASAGRRVGITLATRFRCSSSSVTSVLPKRSATAA